MNQERLTIYLHDHVALMVGEIELARRCRSNNAGTSLADYLQQLETEVASQRSVVELLLNRTGERSTITSQLKQGAAWFAEKLGRFKLNDSLLSYSELSRVLELEMLSAAAGERVALWDNLETVTDGDPSLESLNFPTLRQQSQQQVDELNTRRRFAAMLAFRSTGATA